MRSSNSQNKEDQYRYRYPYQNPYHRDDPYRPPSRIEVERIEALSVGGGLSRQSSLSDDCDDDLATTESHDNTNSSIAGCPPIAISIRATTSPEITALCKRNDWLSTTNTTTQNADHWNDDCERLPLSYCQDDTHRATEHRTVQTTTRSTWIDPHINDNTNCRLETMILATGKYNDFNSSSNNNGVLLSSPPSVVAVTRPTLHRRVSHDMLPTPDQIAGTTATATTTIETAVQLSARTTMHKNGALLFQQQHQ
jgi:hypothetical protein